MISQNRKGLKTNKARKHVLPSRRKLFHNGQCKRETDDKQTQHEAKQVGKGAGSLLFDQRQRHVDIATLPLFQRIPLLNLKNALSADGTDRLFVQQPRIDAARVEKVLTAQGLNHIPLLEFCQANAARWKVLDILDAFLLEMPLLDGSHKSLASMLLIRRRALIQ